MDGYDEQFTICVVVRKVYCAVSTVHFVLLVY
jgi:hypothetical protein